MCFGCIASHTGRPLLHQSDAWELPARRNTINWLLCQLALEFGRVNSEPRTSQPTLHGIQPQLPLSQSQRSVAPCKYTDPNFASTSSMLCRARSHLPRVSRQRMATVKHRAVIPCIKFCSGVLVMALLTLFKKGLGVYVRRRNRTRLLRSPSRPPASR